MCVSDAQKGIDLNVSSSPDTLELAGAGPLIMLREMEKGCLLKISHSVSSLPTPTAPDLLILRNQVSPRRPPRAPSTPPYACPPGLHHWPEWADRSLAGWTSFTRHHPLQNVTAQGLYGTFRARNPHVVLLFTSTLLRGALRLL